MKGLTTVWRRALALAAALVLATSAGVAGADTSRFGETLLWRLDPPGGGQSSYLLGTIHVVDERLQPAIARALERLDETGALVVEVDVSDAAQLDVINAMLLPDGRTLPEIIGGDQFDRLAEIAAGYGLPAEFLTRLAPWGAALMISVPVEQIERMASGAPVFDQSLVDAADARRMPVEILESVEEQIAAFADHPEADQVTMLGQALDLHPRLDAMVAEMMDRYLDDDLAGLAEVALREMDMGDDGLSERVLAALIVDRNHRMAERVIPLLETRPHLVAVGALHLPGPEGLLNLLTQAGWTVKPSR
ncbi:MAG: TraB/GumN family protein [Alphaproteobacteria bacterium]